MERGDEFRDEDVLCDGEEYGAAEELEEDVYGGCDWEVALREEGHECYYWLEVLISLWFVTGVQIGNGDDRTSAERTVVEIGGNEEYHLYNTRSPKPS